MDRILSTSVRKIPVGRTIGLSIVTLGVYAALWGYRNAHDLRQDRPSHKRWQFLFWAGFPTLGLTWGVLAIFNFVRLNEMRAAIGIPPHRDGVWAMVLVWFPLINVIAAFLWANYWNHSVDLLTA